MIDIDKFICSLMAMQQGGFNTQYLVLSSALKAQGLEYKDGKIVRVDSAIKESEGEKVRKELLKHLKEGADGYEPAGNSEDYERWLGWFEKQGEQKDILEDAILDSNEDGLIAETIRYKKERQGEQKRNQRQNI